MINMLENRRITRRMSSERMLSSAPEHTKNNEGDAMEVFAYFRNPSEEIFLRGVVDGTLSSLAPTLDGFGLQNPPQLFHVTSEELFNTWISNDTDQSDQSRGLSVQYHGGSSRMSSEIVAAFLAQQNIDPVVSEDCSRQQEQNGTVIHSNGQSRPPRNPSGNQKQGSDSPALQKLNWFQQNYTMTRGRSSELRLRYLATQESSVGTSPKRSLDAALEPNQDTTNPNQASPLAVPSYDSVSTVVSMLKGSLERKKNEISSDEGQAHVIYPRNGVQFSAEGHSNSASRAASEGLSYSSFKQQTTKGEPGSTKKRRIERKRMMTEAKGRGQLPTTPIEMPAAAKRCENLEKEVRSLKLNLAFMNRKDSEQTKRIEDLEEQNEKLVKEKQAALEELERLTSRTYDPNR